MKTTLGFLLASVLALAACSNTTDMAPAPSGGSAGAEGPGYCDSPPANPDDLSDWNQLCSPQR